MAGDNLTFCDFSMFELLDFMDSYSEGRILQKYRGLAKYHERMRSLPRFADAWADDAKLRKEPFTYG